MAKKAETEPRLKLVGRDDGVALLRRGLTIALAEPGAKRPTVKAPPPPAAPVYAPAIDIKGKKPVADALRRILRACVANIVDNEDAALAGIDPEGVHQMRISLQRMRSALILFGRMLDRDSVVCLRRELGWLASRLGAARDWDVFLTEILPAVQGEGVDGAALDALRDEAMRKQADAYDGVRKAVGSARYARLLLRSTAFAETVEWMPGPAARGAALLDPLDDHAGKLLTRLRCKLMREAEGIKTMDAPGRHAVRIRLKRLRYGVEFLRGLYDGNGKKGFIASAKALQDAFGHLNDMAQVEHLLAEIAPGDDPARAALVARGGGQVLGWYAHRLRAVEGDFLSDWARFADQKPFWKPGKGKPRRKGKPKLTVVTDG